MLKIGLLSDTHNYLDPQIFDYFADRDEIWHVGDFGSIEVSEKLSQFKKLRAVYGNIDGQYIRQLHPRTQKFKVEGIEVWMNHKGGYPGRYNKRFDQTLSRFPPQLYISGHSHILKIVRDKKLNNMLVVNPGAAGRYGIHQVRTIIRFELNKGKIQNMDVIELGTRGS